MTWKVGPSRGASVYKDLEDGAIVDTGGASLVALQCSDEGEYEVTVYVSVDGEKWSREAMVAWGRGGIEWYSTVYFAYLKVEYFGEKRARVSVLVKW